MPSLDVASQQAPPASMPVVIKPSLVCELVWAMSLHPPQTEEPYPARVALLAERGGLDDRIRGFWDDGQCFFTEVLVLADRAGALFEEDPERLFALLEEEAAATSQRVEPLGSEPVEDQRRFRARLKRLRDR